MTNVAKIQIYKDEAGEWRWRAIADNGEIVVPPEGHTRDEDALRAAKGVFDQPHIRFEWPDEQ